MRGLTLGMLAASLGLVVWLVSSSSSPEGAGEVDSVATSSAAEKPEAAALTPVATELHATVPLVPDGPLRLEIQARYPKRDGVRLPAAGLELQIGVAPVRQRTEPLRRVISDADGMASSFITPEEIERVAAGKTPVVWVFSEGKGLLPRSVMKALPTSTSEPLSLILEVRPGVKLRGTLIGSDGEPVAGSVSIALQNGEPVSGRGDRVAADGRFELNVTVEGSTILRGSGASGRAPSDAGHNAAMDLGTGISDPIDVEFTGTYDDLVVQVSGPGRLEGRVVDASGVAASGIQLWAFHVDLYAADGEHHFEYTDNEGGGHRSMIATTASDGSFLMPGLRAGMFSIERIEPTSGHEETFSRLTQEPVSSLGGPLLLELTRPYLAVHVRNADDSEPAPDFRAHSSGFGAWEGDDWPEEPGLLVIQTDRWRTWSYYPERLAVHSLGAGEFTVELKAPSVLRVATFGGALPFSIQSLVIPTDAGRVDLDLRLPPVGANGGVSWDARDAAGEPVLEGLRFRLLDPATGFPIVDEVITHAESTDWPRRVELPEGSYLLKVDGAARFDRQHGALLARRGHGGSSTELVVGPHSEQRITARLGAGARLDLEVLGEVGEREREAILLEYPDDRGWGSGSPRERREEYTRAAVITLRSEGRRPEGVQFNRPPRIRSEDSGLWSSGPWEWALASYLELGQRATSELLSAGTYTLVATLAGGRAVSKRIELHDGQTTSVTLVFE